MDIKDIENQNQIEEGREWKICCSHSSEAFIKYIITVLFSLIVVLFSIYMIVNEPERDNSIYFSLISSILTLYIPSPSLERLKELN